MPRHEENARGGDGPHRRDHGPRAWRRKQDLAGTGEVPGVQPPHDSWRHLGVLTLGALGVVYGDIGTSPLYTMKECFHGAHGIPVNNTNVLGVLSLIFWSLVIIISVKYLAYVMRYDNQGEGGILALMSLVPASKVGRRRHWLIITLGLFGAALLYGDGVIAPAITVLSAIEGLNVATPVFEPYVIPITVAILVGLFAVQRRGTAGIGAMFGPVMSVWFAVLALLGIRQIARAPEVLLAVSPHHAARFFAYNEAEGFFILASVFLVVTGGESLYIDMGHFGKRPIRLAWFTLVLPALLLNYFGQGAYLLHHPGGSDNPFFRSAPSWALYPLLALAATAAVIASQAVISGAFSITRQAVQLGYAPRLSIVHTSAEEIGQIYVPAINWVMMLASIGLVLGFQKATNLAGAYGIAVSTTMVITTVVSYVVSRKARGWTRWLALSLTLPFFLIDITYWSANATKIAHGGWFPLLMAVGVYALLTTWKKGREVLASREAEGTMALDLFLADVERRSPHRVPGISVYLTTSPEGVPRPLLHNFKHNRVLHQKVVFLTVVTEEVPHVPHRGRVTVEELGHGFHRVIARYGFMEDPDVPRILELARRKGLELDFNAVSFFLGRDTLIATRRRRGMALWRERLFVLMKRNALGADRFFKLPPNRVIELGAQIEL
jgi:KUP system potassium uptake protein